MSGDFCGSFLGHWSLVIFKLFRVIYAGFICLVIGLVALVGGVDLLFSFWVSFLINCKRSLP
jgi:hypothetical protein